MIEKDESVLNHITKRFDIIGILGNGANFKILEQADVEDCDIFISMTEYDEVNMVSAVLAKKMGAGVVKEKDPLSLVILVCAFAVPYFLTPLFCSPHFFCCTYSTIFGTKKRPTCFHK